MKLYVASDLDFDPETAWEIFESDEYGRRLEQATDLVCTVLSEGRDGDIATRHVRYVSKRELPGMVAKALGSKSLTYEQHNRFDAARSRMDWRVVIPASDRVQVSGITTITATPTGSRRVVDGDITVQVRLIGGQIEKAVVAEFERSMRRAVDLVRQIHDERSAEG